MSQPPVTDFEAMYQGDPDAGPLTPWDIRDPQPFLVDLEESGELRGDVLDVGCGLGDNAAFLASRGHRVTGVDGAPTAIRLARERAAAKGLDIEFAVVDATRLDGFEGRFDTVLDSALYHCLDEDTRNDYVAALHRATRPGAHLHIFCFSPDLPKGFPAPFWVTEPNLRETLAHGWTITRLEPGAYTTSMAPEQLRQTVRTVSPDVDVAAVDGLNVDAQGRVLLPIWKVAAQRS